MPGIVALVSQISDDVIADLATANYPALIDGKILLGKQFQFEQSAPPRIIFTPTNSDFPAKDVYNASPTAPGGYTAEQLAQNRNRSVLSDMINFEVRCWGVSPNQDPDYDYDYTQALYQQVIRSVNKLCYGTYWCTSGKWTDATYQSGQLNRDGREFVLNITFGTPILERLEPMPLAPDGVRPGITDDLTLPNGQSGVGCED